MHRVSKNIAGLCVCLCVWLGASLNPAESRAAGTPNTTRITLVYISTLSDIEKKSSRGGLAELATLLKQERSRNQHVVFIHGGNALGPSVLSSFDKGAHMIGLLNLLEPAAMAVSKREFVHKEDELALRAREAAFPMLAANLFDTATNGSPDGITGTLLLPVGSHFIGLTAIVSPDLDTTFIPERVRVSGSFELLPELARSLRAGGASYVIAMSDSIPENPEKILHDSDVDMLLLTGGKQPGVTVLGNRMYAVDDENNDALVVELEFSPLPGSPGGIKTQAAVRLLGEPHRVPLASLLPDPAMEENIARYAASLVTLLSFPVGQSKTALDTTTKLLRTAENAFANMVTDAMRAYYQADLALLNSGTIRGNRLYPAGSTLTRQDIHSELPLPDVTVLLELDGATFARALEHGLSRVQDARGMFPHVSGARYVYSPNAPPGERLRDVFINGAPLDLKKRYTLSTVAYLANGGDGYTMLKNATRPPTSYLGQNLAELVRVYITQKGAVAPVTEGRISLEGGR